MANNVMRPASTNEDLAALPPLVDIPVATIRHPTGYDAALRFVEVRPSHERDHSDAREQGPGTPVYIGSDLSRLANYRDGEVEALLANSNVRVFRPECQSILSERADPPEYPVERCDSISIARKES